MTTKPTAPQPTLEQGTAIEMMQRFLAAPDQLFFLLSGYAGTGKTFCIKHFADNIRGRLIFTAPTNKATKVLRDTITTEAYKPECRTIYSLLGLKMEANGEVKELSAPEDPVCLKDYRAVVVDECGMISSQLWEHIVATAKGQGVKFILMGDPAQLPPVGEPRSPVWLHAHSHAKLHTVMRHDNQILTLATSLREKVDHPAPNFKLREDHDDNGGVWVTSGQGFMTRIREAAKAGTFSDAGKSKAVAWRNVTVDELNAVIRREIFGEAAAAQWLPGDRIILTGPAKNLDGEVIATTDDEGKVNKVEEAWHEDWPEYKIFRLTVTLDDNRVVTLRVLHSDSARAFEVNTERLAAAARTNRRLWPDFWELKEAFAPVRHAYAITAHRAQGSTYDTVFVDWRDILLNRNRQEAFRCLYVACTRPKTRLILN